jgi:hypothetical protein
MIAFVCRHCGRQNSVGDEWAGQSGQCPWCNQDVEIPAAPAPSNAPILFHCRHCGHKLSVAGAWAGKQGKCPECQQTIQIPLASEPEPAAAPPPAPAPAADSPQPSGNVEFNCRQCGHRLTVPGEWAGKRGKCPSCKAPLNIPLRSEDPLAPPSPGGKVSLICPHCERKNTFGPEWAGKRRQCTWCGSEVDVPRASTAPSAKDTYGLSDDGTAGEDRSRYRGSEIPYEEVDPARRKKPLYGDGADLPSPRHRTDGGGSSSGGEGNTVIGWVVFFLIFVVGNIILYNTVGIVLIPRR